MNNNITSKELNLRGVRKLVLTKGFREPTYPHKTYPNVLSGWLTNEVNQNGWRFSNEVFL